MSSTRVNKALLYDGYILFTVQIETYQYMLRFVEQY